jgi:hypothetical protein
VIVRDGVYTTTGTQIASIIRSGTAGSPIVFKSEHKFGAVLDGQNNKTTQGLFFSGVAYIVFQDFEFQGFQGGAIKIHESSNNITIRGNKIHEIGRICSDSDYGQTAIHVAVCSNIIIDKNIIYNIGRFAPGENGCSPATSYWQNHDHGIYIEREVNTLVISNNLIYNCKAGWCIHIYNTNGLTDTNISIINNVFANPNPNREGHIVLSECYLVNGLIANNIFYNPTVSAINVGQAYFSTSNTVIKNNITHGGTITNGTVSGISLSQNLNNTNPLMASPSTCDFRLMAGSPAINSGVNVGLTCDYLSYPIIGLPDIGAYEYQGASATIYYNTQMSSTAIKNDCGAGSTGSTVTYTVTAKKYSSTVSQSAADNLATTDLNTNKQAYANANGTCSAIAVYYNSQISATATKNDCGTGYTGSTVTYTVPAKKYSSTVSQTAADNLAATDLNTNKQAYANANGTCTALPVSSSFGLTTVGSIPEKGDNGFWIANSFTAASNMTVSKMNIYVGTASGKARLGIYSDKSGQPGTLIAQTGEITLVNGWNSGMLGSSKTLTSGVTYWIAIEVTSSATTLYFNNAAGRLRYKSYTYGLLPSSAPLKCASGTGIYSVYAN